MFKLRKDWKNIIEKETTRACTIQDVIGDMGELGVTAKSFRFNGVFDSDMDLEITEPDMTLYLPFNAIKYIDNLKEK